MKFPTNSHSLINLIAFFNMTSSQAPSLPFIVNARNVTKNRVWQREVKSILHHRLRHKVFHFHVQESPEALLKTDSVIA